MRPTGALRDREQIMTSPTHTTTTVSDDAAIRAVVTDQREAFRTRDADRVVARYATDAVRYDLAPPLRRTGPEVRDAAAVRAWFGGFAGPVDLEIADLDVVVGGDVAYCHSLNRMAAVPHGSPEGFSMWFRSTVCLRRIDGAWRITHEHISTPFAMDGSFLACTDLQP